MHGYAFVFHTAFVLGERDSTEIMLYLKAVSKIYDRNVSISVLKCIQIQKKRMNVFSLNLQKWTADG